MDKYHKNSGVFTKEYLYDLHYNQDISTTLIAKKHDCSITSICYYFKKFNIKCRKSELLVGKPSTSSTKFKKNHTPYNKGKSGYKNKNYPKIMPRGKDSPNWKGGGKPRDRNTNEYKKWRLSVFESNDYTCQHCFVRGCYLHAHHIVYWLVSEELRYEKSNGITLCKGCHYKLHKNDNSGVLNIV